LKYRGILRATAAAAAVATVALAAPAAAGAATVGVATRGAGAHPVSGAVPVRHWHPRAVNLHTEFERMLGHVKLGRRMGIVPPVGKKMVTGTVHRRGNPGTGKAGCTEPNCNLVWNHGPVEHTPKLYVVFWGPTWQTDTGEQASESYLLNFFTGLGKSDDTWSLVNSQYTDSTGHPTFSGSELVNEAVDTASPPAEVTMGALASEAAAFATHFSIPDVANDQVVVVSQSGTCFADGFAGSSCTPVQASYCAWHSATSFGAGTLSYTNLPYQLDAAGSCGEGFVNSPGTWDGFSIVGGHEFAEAVTDPYPSSGWWDPNDSVSGGEIGDKCAWGGQIWGSNDPIGNITLSGVKYAVQSLWDNHTTSCQMATTVGPQATSVSTMLTGDGQSGPSVTVPLGTAVTDAATLSGTNAATAGGTVTYAAFSNAGCTTSVFSGSPQTITTPGVLPASPAESFAIGTYYWKASYSGDASNMPSASTCGPTGEVETVTKAATSLTTALSGFGKTGAVITVPSGTSVKDTATLAGSQKATASGTVTYKVFSNATCTAPVGTPMAVTVSGGVVPASPAVPLTTAGKYYWTATYSGDATNKPSATACGGEIATVPPVVAFDTIASGLATTTAVASVTTTGTGELLVAYVGARGPRGKSQVTTVSASGLKWTLVGRSNAGRGDAEVWWARAAGKLTTLHVRATATFTGFPVAISVVAYKNAPGVGAHAVSHSVTAGAPTGSLTTTAADSWVFAAGDDWVHGTGRTPVAGQTVVKQFTTSTDTFWTQATRKVTYSPGTVVNIRDTSPTTDPYNLVLVEIR
jgi:serine protease